MLAGAVEGRSRLPGTKLRRVGGRVCVSGSPDNGEPATTLFLQVSLPVTPRDSLVMLVK